MLLDLGPSNFVIQIESLPVARNPRDFSETRSSFIERHNSFNAFSSHDFLKQGIMGNEFLKNLSFANIRDIVDCMFAVEYKKDSMIIKEGDPGSRVYAIEGNT